MATPKLSDELARQAADAWKACDRNAAAASRRLKLSPGTFDNRLRIAAQRGMLLDEEPAMPGFRVSQVTDGPNGKSVQQKPEHGGPFELPPGHRVKGVSTLVDGGTGEKIVEWIKTMEDAAATEAAMRATVDALSEKIPRAKPIAPPKSLNDLLANQFTVTDAHFGMLSWREETGADYDLKIAEELLTRFFEVAIALAPSSAVAVLAQLGDMLHHDSWLSVTPTHAHVLDADSRLQKMIRVVIRVLRRVIDMLLAKFPHVHIVMADANHDPAGGAWLREMFAAFYENEPRISVDNSAGTYYAYEFGETALFYHHGHKRKIKTVDTVFAGLFREIYGRTKYAYGHIGHLHSDEMLSTNLMKVERHETLAAPDAHAANGGWLSGRSAKVITYHKHFGEVARSIITPQMLQTGEAAA